MTYIWFSSVIETIKLIIASAFISLIIGSFTSIFAWKSSYKLAYYAPIMILSVPPWLFAFFISDYFTYIDPFIGASISLGICSSPYCHAVICSSLTSRAYKSYEALLVLNGLNIKSVLYAIYPSLRISVLPSIAIVSAEVVSDFGVANYFGLNTLTMLSYNIWSTTWSFSNSAYGIIWLIIIGITLSLLKNTANSSINSSNSSKKSLYSCYLSLLPTVFFIVFCYFTSLSWLIGNGFFHSKRIIEELLNTTFLVVFVVTINIMIGSLFLLRTGKIFEKVGIMTYSIPGIAISLPLVHFLGQKVSLMILLVIAISVRYFGLLVNILSSSLSGSSKYIETITIYSESGLIRIVNIFNFLLPSLAMGVSILVLEITRELPISMVLHPAGFETIAMRMNHISKIESPSLLGGQSVVLITIGLLFTCIIIWSTNDRNKKFEKQ